MQLAQRLAGLDAELIHVAGAGGLEGRQRVGLPSGAIQRHHLQLDQALLEGMRDHQRLQLAQQLAVAAQFEVELDPLDRRGEARLLEPRALAIKQLVHAHSLERRSTPHTERLLDCRPRGLESTGRACLLRPVERRLPAVNIARAGTQLQDVAARPPDQPVCVAARLRERLAQPRDVHLQAATRPRRKVLAPQLIDQPLTAHHASPDQRQHREQRARPLTAERDLAAIDPGLDRTEQLDPKPTVAVHRGQSRPSSRVTRLYADRTPVRWRCGGRRVHRTGPFDARFARREAGDRIVRAP